MKRLSPLILFIAIVLSSCSSVSNKSVSEKLTTDELGKAIKNDTAFSAFYESVRKSVDNMSDIKKAKYKDITYNMLFKYFKFITDTTYWKPLSESWDKEWTDRYGSYLPKADSTLSYWRKYLEENSLNKYVKIDLTQIDKEYYEYAGGLKEVNMGFRLTPLQGPIQQIRFTYGYKPKINGDNKYYEKHSCISTAPFSVPTVRFWEVDYSDRDNFGGKNVETFLRDYNLYIDITNIRKDGKNISTDDFSVPAKVSECFENEKDYPTLFEISKQELIRDIINKDFISKWEYRNKKADEIKEKKDKLCFDFVKDL
ncbi:hypothetical protein QEG73_00340 [Chitinophagaceae bacterium 26-R-25]|nr:hypothetical protein [Chitinophagaceae bacterium 26-R-25]